MTVERLCHRVVDLATVNETAEDAAKRMEARNVGTLVIMDSDKHPIGLLTDRDLVTRVMAESLDPAAVEVGEIMSKDLQTIKDDTPIESALETMRKGPYRRLIVVNERDELSGIITIDDVLRLLAAEFNSIGEVLTGEKPETMSFG